jgi:hypothetical protein
MGDSLAARPGEARAGRRKARADDCAMLAAEKNGAALGDFTLSFQEIGTVPMAGIQDQCLINLG